MKKIYIIISFLIFSFANAEVVKKIEIEGNSKISDETIKVYGDIETNTDYKPSDINIILKKLYSTEFFETINLDLQNGILKINVKEYPTINAILIEGEKTKKVQKAILERLQLKEKNAFIKNKLTEDINTIKKIYSTMGFNFIEVDTKIKNFDDNRLNLVFFVDKGIKTKIKKINFIGDKKVKDRRLRDIIASEEHKFWKVLSKNTNLIQYFLFLVRE